MKKDFIDGDLVLAEALKQLDINLSLLIAETSIWAHPDIVKEKPVWFPNTRRGRKNEKRGTIIDGIYIDDNTKANYAIKQACKVQPKNFSVCHIYPGTAYDPRYHTAIANLVLLPQALSSLTDHNEEIIKVLQYRSYALYDWVPEGFPIPKKPESYPYNWLPLHSLSEKDQVINKKNEIKKYEATPTKPFLMKLVKDLYPLLNDKEITNLQDYKFCKSEFNLYYPLFMEKHNMTSDLKCRYYSEKYLIDNKYYVCSQWFKKKPDDNFFLFKKFVSNLKAREKNKK